MLTGDRFQHLDGDAHTKILETLFTCVRAVAPDDAQDFLFGAVGGYADDGPEAQDVIFP